jgi:hypothetical protein
MLARLFLVPALLAAAPAGAQTASADPLAIVGNWVGKFAAISAEPTAAAAACGPQLGNAVGTARDAAAARAAVPRIRPCLDQIRAAYRRSVESLAQFGAAPAEVQAAAPFDANGLIEQQRKQFVAALAYIDDLEAFLGAMAANDRPGATRLVPKVRSGGAALVDGSILQLRAYQGTARFGFTRSAIELRILVAEATKLPMTGTASQAGFAIGGGLNALAPRARAAAAAVRSGWEQDKASLRALAGGDAGIERLIGPATPMVDTIAASGDQIAVGLQRGGSQPVVPVADMIALMNELSQHELTIARSVQNFAQTLQTIGK